MQGGITRIELYIVYNLSGGKEKIKQRRKAEPLAKPEALQTALADFKRRMRKVVRRNVKEEDEKFFQTSYARVNSLKKLAVQNKHAAITGLPNLPEAMAKEVAKAIVILKGIYQKKHRAAHGEGNLMLLPKSMAYKGSAEV